MEQDEQDVAIYRLLQYSAFGPEDITPLVAAYDDCLRTLNLADRSGSDPITQLIAKKIIEIAQTGMRDPVQIGRLALKERRIMVAL